MKKRETNVSGTKEEQWRSSRHKKWVAKSKWIQKTMVANTKREKMDEIDDQDQEYQRWRFDGNLQQTIISILTEKLIIT